MRRMKTRWRLWKKLDKKREQENEADTKETPGREMERNRKGSERRLLMVCMWYKREKLKKEGK